MTMSSQPGYELPQPVSDYLSRFRDKLRDRRTKRLRLYPVVLRSSLEDLFERRRKLFTDLQPWPTDYGYALTYLRKLKKSNRFPDGRSCEGTFDVLQLSPSLAIVASALIGHDHKEGPRRLVERAYPIARVPFFPSTSLIRIIEHFASGNGWTPIARDTYGYHRQSRRLRRDMEFQKPSAAAREMSEQRRQVHRMEVSYRRDKTEFARISFDRNAQLEVVRGNPISAVRGLLLHGVNESDQRESLYAITRSPRPIDQEVLEIDFANDTFDDYESMHSLCDAVRESGGLNVAIIHLNPYLQAQVLDFYTGESVDLVVTTTRRISLLPRSRNATLTIRRIADGIFQYFGEGKATKHILSAGRD